MESSNDPSYCCTGTISGDCIRLLKIDVAIDCFLGLSTRGMGFWGKLYCTKEQLDHDDEKTIWIHMT